MSVSLLTHYNITTTLCLKNVPFYILNNAAKINPFLITFGVQNPEEISHQQIVKSPTLSKMSVAALPCKTQSSFVCSV